MPLLLEKLQFIIQKIEGWGKLFHAISRGEKEKKKKPTHEPRSSVALLNMCGKTKIKVIDPQGTGARVVLWLQTW